MMPLLGPHFLAAVGLLAAAKKTSSSSSGIFLIFIIVIAGVYLLFIAPQKRRQRAAQLGQQRNFEIGDEVVTTGGIFGRVESNDGDRIELDIADGVIIEVAPTAIARRVEPVGSATGYSGADATDADDEESGEAVTGHDWQAPAADSAVTTSANGNGAASNGAASNGGKASGGAASKAKAKGAAQKDSEWADPWTPPPTAGEKDVPPQGGSS